MANGEAISHGEKPSNTSWAGLAIDSNGVLWSTGSEYVSSSTVAGWSTVGNEEMTVAKVKVDGADWYSESNFINWTVAPDSGEELAPTGGNALIAGALVALSVLALAAGVVTRRATRRHRA